MLAWIIDDDKIVCSLLGTMLGAKEYNISSFNSAAEAIEATNKLATAYVANCDPGPGDTNISLPSLVMIDLQLGEDSGHLLMTKLQESILKDAHFVLMSSNTREEAEDLHGIKETDKFLQKPFRAADLFELLPN